MNDASRIGNSTAASCDDGTEAIAATPTASSPNDRSSRSVVVVVSGGGDAARAHSARGCREATGCMYVGKHIEKIAQNRRPRRCIYAASACTQSVADKVQQI